MGQTLPEAGPQPSMLLMSPDRLRKIDLLRDKNFSKHVPLPQLVAVGDQSTGKSSLLEGLTGIPFPRGHDQCTRYATQITHRRDSHVSISISIIPASNVSEEEKAPLLNFQRSAETTAQLQERLPSILAAVNKLMGIRTSENLEGTRQFTENVLKIEKCGPTEDYLTVIDVPGIFRVVGKSTNATTTDATTTDATTTDATTTDATSSDDTSSDDTTTDKDKSLVLNMVENYIRDDRTIILAVLPSNVDVDTQEILGLAKRYDPDGQRTLGILTKPDLVSERGVQRKVCELVNGKRRRMNLGYQLVRSRGADDNGGPLSDEQRDSIFKEEPWCHLPSDRLGVVALRQRLQHLLGELIDKTFPKLRTETSAMLTKAVADLEQLGKSRQTERQQQQYLASVSSKFQNIVRAALNADYSSSDIFDNDAYRLITTVLNMADEFGTNFVAAAHTYQFLSQGQDNSDTPDSDYGELSGSKENCQHSSPPFFGHEGVSFNQFPDLNAVIHRNLDSSPPSAGVMEWIRKVHRRSRGSELTSYTASLFASAFRQQTSKWQKLTEFFISKVIYTIHEFTVNALEKACADVKVRERLLSHMWPSILGRYDAAMKQTRLLVQVERDGQPYTLNKAFREALSRLQVARTAHDLSTKLADVGIADPNGQSHVISLDHVQAALRDKNSDKYIADEVHDLLQSYYQVARDRFIDTVYLQVVSYGLLSGPESPLGLFCHDWVLGLEEDKLEAIAGESFQTREQRDTLVRKIQELEAAVTILL